MSADASVTVLDCGDFIVMTRPERGRRKNTSQAFIFPKWRLSPYVLPGVRKGGPYPRPAHDQLVEVRLYRDGFAFVDADNPESGHVPVVAVEGRTAYDDAWRLLSADQIPDLRDDPDPATRRGRAAPRFALRRAREKVRGGPRSREDLPRIERGDPPTGDAREDGHRPG